MKTIHSKNIVTLFFTIVSFLGFSQNQEAIFFTKSNTFFSTYVHNGKVAYQAIKNEPTSLNELIQAMESIKIPVSNANSYRAFWINAYNLTVIKAIVSKYPVKSPLDITGFFDKKKHLIASEKLTLNTIENNKLRKLFKNDPRFHFALVCAGLGCPPLISEAYLPKTIEQQLTVQAKKAINNNNFIKLNAKNKKVSVSQLFKWYASDFTQNKQSIIDFLNTYRIQKIPTTYSVSYYEYNWNLNKIN